MTLMKRIKRVFQAEEKGRGLRMRLYGRGRGSVYDPVFGICCHFCRQKKLCGEKDCKRCCNFDTDEPCLGKTDCSVCHSSNGVFCRACLKVRYGEEMEKVRENKGWMCPHCIEEKGIKPYWICNSSLCLRKRKIAPTGIAIYRAWEMGYKSVAHLLMDELKCANKI
ncbi:cell division cycle-associated protein 7-like [Quillaja saponaria]|uniref:Cell division cycle-associated protein 7-like n=1 Tax=Quillaja saponaria TaxID=32244 RepID=A0AAD7Q5L4_QUISA|nr:cell division cycle-associated protein 7-like [Quillaja saponaria]